MATKTPADSLRSHAGKASGTRWEEALDEINNLTEAKEAAETAAEALGELDNVVDQVTQARDALETLKEYDMASTKVVDLLTDALSMLEEANGVVSADDLTAMTETWDEAQAALEEYGNIKDTERYEGKRDDLEAQWTHCTEQMEALADAWDSLLVVEETSG